MQRRALAFLIALLVLGIAFAAYRLSEHTAEQPPTPVAPPAIVTAADELRIDGAEPAIAQREPLGAARTQPKGGIRVRVFERQSGHAIAGAEVRFAGANVRVRNDVHRPFEHVEDDEFLASVGTMSITDAHGETYIALDSLPAIVDARFGGLWASMWITEPPTQPVQLALDADREITIQVVDGAGRVASGVPVAIGRCPGNVPNGDAWSALTDDTGVTRVRHVERLLQSIAKQSACVRLAVLARDLESVPIDPKALPDHPVRLLLPVTGSVEVEVVSEGSPVFAQSLELLEASSMLNQGFDLNARMFEPSMNDVGRAEFTHVGLGLDVCVMALENGYQPARVKAKGPQVAGERVKIVLDLGKANPALVARLVDDHSRPIAGAQLAIEFNTRSPTNIASILGQSFVTDEQGRLRVWMPTSETTSLSGTLAFRIESPSSYRGARASLIVPSELHDGDNDMGDLTLKPPEIVVTGTVVDDLDEVVPNAMINLSEPMTPASKKWDPISSLTSTSDARGEFAVRGVMPTSILRVNAREAHHAAGVPVEVQPGERGVRVVIPRGAELAGSLRLDPSLARSELKAVVKRFGTPAAAKPEFDGNDVARVQEDGSFALSSLRAGRVGLEISSPVVTGPLCVVDDIDLSPGIANRDPRLQEVDLRDVRLIRVDVVNERNEPVLGGTVWSSTAARAPLACLLHDGKAVLVARDASVDIRVEAPGYRTTRIDSVASDVRVRMQRGFALRVRVPYELALPEPPRQLGVSLRWMSSGATSSTEGSRAPVLGECAEGFIEAGAETTVLVPAAGTYELRWIVRRDASQHSRHVELKNLHVARIDVAESDDGQTITLAPDPDELAEALRAFVR
jgi:hypothetical protein